MPDYTADSAPDAGLGAFIMLPEGVARLFVPGQFVDGPWSEHYEPVESPVANPLHPEHSSNPAVRAFTTEFDVLGKPDEFPIVCTTYRLTEHFHYWTKNNPYNVQLQPEFFVEIPEELAAREGHRQRRRGARHLGARVDRGPRDGHAAHQADADRRHAPCTRSDSRSTGASSGRGQQRGSLANLLTPTVVDPNSFAPEYKGFLVKLEKVVSGVAAQTARDSVAFSASHLAPSAPGVRQPARRRQAASTPRRASAARPARWPARSGTTCRRRPRCRWAPTRRCPT